jgi:DNA-binding MarR family transcriptional regulator
MNDIFNLDFTFFYYDSNLGRCIGRSPAVFISALRLYIKNGSPIKKHEGWKWIGKTTQQLAEELGYSKRQITNIIHTLRQQDLIFIKKFNSHQGNNTNFYAVNEEALKKLLKSKTKRNSPKKSFSPNLSSKETH